LGTGAFAAGSAALVVVLVALAMRLDRVDVYG
jgi:hypothetical protein